MQSFGHPFTHVEQTSIEGVTNRVAEMSQLDAPMPE
jgi:hypothetical protein